VDRGGNGSGSGMPAPQRQRWFGPRSSVHVLKHALWARSPHSPPHWRLSLPTSTSVQQSQQIITKIKKNKIFLNRA
jgi:hypothetical protein